MAAAVPADPDARADFADRAVCVRVGWAAARVSVAGAAVDDAPAASLPHALIPSPAHSVATSVQWPIA